VTPLEVTDESCAEHGWHVDGHLPAPELSLEEAATLHRFDLAPDAPESLRERVARSMCAAEFPNAWRPWDGIALSTRRRLLRSADAAIEVMRGHR
jgi:hypothetical protein